MTPPPNPTPDPVGDPSASPSSMEPAPSGALHLAVDDDGWGGHVHIDPSETIPYDGNDVPVMTWHLPMYRAETLIQALELLDQVGEVTGGDISGELEYGWKAEVAVLRAALEHMVATGRAERAPEGHMMMVRSTIQQ